jgi:hypothetical protein
MADDSFQDRRRFWRTAAGEIVAIDEMQDNHLLATILYLEKRGAESPEYVAMVEEARSRGIMVTVQHTRRLRVEADARQRAGNYAAECNKRVSTVGDARCILEPDHKGLCSAAKTEGKKTEEKNTEVTRFMLLEID